MANIVNIPTTEESYFLQYLTILKPISRMRDKEIQILAQLMFYNNRYSHLEQEVREKMVFDTDTRMRIRQKLKMSEASFNNCLTELRKKNVIVGTRLSKAYNIFTNGGREELTFRFSIKENGTAETSSADG